MKNSRDDESGIIESLDHSSETGELSRLSSNVEEEELLEAITEEEGIPPSTEASDMSFGDMMTALISNPKPEARKNFFKGLDRFYDSTVQAAFRDTNGTYITDRPIPVDHKEDSPTVASAKHLYNALYYSEIAADQKKYNPMAYWNYGQAVYELSQIDYASIEDISQTMGTLYDNIGHISSGSEEFGAQIYDHLPPKGKAAAKLTFNIDEDSGVPARQQFGRVLTFQQGSLSQSDDSPAVDLSEEVETITQSLPNLGYQRNNQGLFIHPADETGEERSEIALLNVLQCALKINQSQNKFCANRYWNTGKWALKLKSELGMVDVGALKQEYGSQILDSVQRTLKDIDANLCPVYEFSDLSEDQSRVKQGTVSGNISSIHEQLQSIADQIGLELPGTSTQYLPQRILTRQRHIEFLQSDKPQLEQEQKRLQNCIRLLEKHNSVETMSVHGAKFLLKNLDLLKLDPDLKEGFRQAFTKRIENPGKSAGIQEQGYFYGTVGTLGKWSGQSMMASVLNQANATNNRYSAAIKTNESQQIATQERINEMFQQLSKAPSKLAKKQGVIEDRIDSQQIEIRIQTDLKNELKVYRNNQEKPLSNNIIRLLKDNYQQLDLDPLTEKEMRDFFVNNERPINENKFYKYFYTEVAPRLEFVINRKIDTANEYIQLLDKQSNAVQTEHGVLQELCDFGKDDSDANVNRLKSNLNDITPWLNQQQQEMMDIVTQENASISKIQSLQEEVKVRNKKMKVSDLSPSAQETLKNNYQTLDLDPFEKDTLKNYFESESSLNSTKRKKNAPMLPENIDSILSKALDQHTKKKDHITGTHNVLLHMQDNLNIAEDDESSIKFTPDQIPSNVNAQKSLARNIDVTRQQLLEKMDGFFDEDVMKEFKDDNGRFIKNQYFNTSKPESPMIRACQEILNMLSTAEYALQKDNYDPRKYGAVLKRGGGYGVQYLWGKYGYGEGITQGAEANEEIKRTIEQMYGHSGEGYNELIGTLKSVKPFLPKSLQETIDSVIQSSPSTPSPQNTTDNQDTEEPFETPSNQDSTSDLPDVIPGTATASDLASKISLSLLYRGLKLSYDTLKKTLPESDQVRNNQGNFKINKQDAEKVKTTKSLLNVLRATAKLTDVINPKTYHQTNLKDITTALMSIDDILTYLPTISLNQLNKDGNEAIKNVLKTIDMVLADTTVKSDVIRDELMLKDPLEIKVNDRIINYDNCFNAVCESFNSVAKNFDFQSTAGNTAPYYTNQRLTGRQQHLDIINEDLAKLDDNKLSDKRKAVGLNRQKKLIAKRMRALAPKRSDIDLSPPIAPPRSDLGIAPTTTQPNSDAVRTPPVAPPRADRQTILSQDSDVHLEGLSNSEYKSLSDEHGKIADEFESLSVLSDAGLSMPAAKSNEELIDMADTPLSEDSTSVMTDATGDLTDALKNQCAFCDEDLPHDSCSDEDGSDGVSDDKTQREKPFGSGSGGI